VPGLRASGGLVWRAAIDEDRVAARAVYEEWARPMRLHHFHARSSNLELEAALEEAPSELPEGEGIENLLLENTLTSSIEVEGELWTRRVAAILKPDASQEKLWSALVFGSLLLNELSEAEMMTLALRGGAVSPVTSYLAIEPGVRPSTEGLSDAEASGDGGFGGGELRSACTFVTGRAPPIDREAFLRDALTNGWRRCGGKPAAGA
jgi:hypothetical protein